MNKIEPKKSLRSEAMRIGGKKISTEKVIEVRYPYTNEVIGTVPRGTAEHARHAFGIAANYKPKLSRFERQRILLKAAELVQLRKEALSDLITLELGISKKDSLYECGRAYDVFTLAGQLALFDDGQIFSCDLTPHGKQRKIYTKREPVRAISAITPFNHPLNMVAHKVAPAIATNNCVVCKPSEATPLTAVALADVLYEAGLPPEMFQVVTGWPQEIGDEMVTNPEIEIITFTGGVAVGKLIAAKAGYKRAALELGGNDPFIVCDDLSARDLEKAAELAVEGATRNSGQRCTAVKRILVMDKIAHDFSVLVVEKAGKIIFGDPMHPATDLGTVVSETAAAAFEHRVMDAESKGAKSSIIRGGGVPCCRRSPSTSFLLTANWCARKPSGRSSRSSEWARMWGKSSASRTRRRSGFPPVYAPTGSTGSPASSTASMSVRLISGKCRDIALRCRPSAALRIRAMV
jgi:putative phosphonoacetaldehyde dehydrogenase